MFLPIEWNELGSILKVVVPCKTLLNVYFVPLRGEGSEKDYSYPYSYPATEMQKNPAYVAMSIDKSLRPQGDEGIPAEHPYDSSADIESLRDIAATSSDEHTLESASYLSYIWTSSS